MSTVHDRFSRQLADLHRRLDTLRQRAGSETSEQVLAETMAELNTTVEELRVADEELRQQAEELQRSHLAVDGERRRYLELFEFAPDGYLVTDEHGTIREINQAGLQLLNRSLGHLLGKPLLVFVDPERRHEFLSQLGGLASDGRAKTWELRLLPRQRPPIDVECSVVAVARLGLAAEVELLWRLHDISDRKRAEEILRQSRQSLRDLSARLEAVREEERARIAREVHDELGSALTAIKMDVAQLRSGIANLAEGSPDDLLARAADTSSLIDETMQTVRRIAMELRPAILDDFGLVAALDWQLNEFQRRSGIKCELHVAPGSVGIGTEHATGIFRVFQEILTNVGRPAQAKRVVVRLSQENGHVLLNVRDDGRGISEADAIRPNALGLVGIRERMEMMGGSVAIHGEPDKGTTVQVRLPL